MHIVGKGFIARQQAENYHWKQLIADPSSFPEHEKAREVTREVTREV